MSKWTPEFRRRYRRLYMKRVRKYKIPVNVTILGVRVYVRNLKCKAPNGK